MIALFVFKRYYQGRWHTGILPAASVGEAKAICAAHAYTFVGEVAYGSRIMRWVCMPLLRFALMRVASSTKKKAQERNT